MIIDSRLGNLKVQTLRKLPITEPRIKAVMISTENPVEAMVGSNLIYSYVTVSPPNLSFEMFVGIIDPFILPPASFRASSK